MMQHRVRHRPQVFAIDFDKFHKSAFSQASIFSFVHTLRPLSRSDTYDAETFNFRAMQRMDTPFNSSRLAIAKATEE